MFIEFEAAFPVEFWREVVDRVAAEAPDTLLLAEAFHGLGQRFEPVLEPTDAKIDLALSNSFGFGGTNVSLVLGR